MAEKMYLIKESTLKQLSLAIKKQSENNTSMSPLDMINTVDALNCYKNSIEIAPDSYEIPVLDDTGTGIGGYTIEDVLVCPEYDFAISSNNEAINIKKFLDQEKNHFDSIFPDTEKFFEIFASNQGFYTDKYKDAIANNQIGYSPYLWIGAINDRIITDLQKEGNRLQMNLTLPMQPCLVYIMNTDGTILETGTTLDPELYPYEYDEMTGNCVLNLPDINCIVFFAYYYEVK